jgi:hypothetical protein
VTLVGWSFPRATYYARSPVQSCSRAGRPEE